MTKIITPYVFEQEIDKHRQLFWDYDIYYEQDSGGIGSDLMFQKMWNKFPDDDIFILHADMSPHHENWFEEVLDYVKRYPAAGMYGCLLLYPAKNDEGKFCIQSAGGKFNKGNPDHFGSGLVIENKSQFKNELEFDEGQYDQVREIAWTTFGGCYLRRTFINSVGGFSPEFEWTYNRDVDFCLTARQNGQKIYQIPVRITHHESKDNKRIKSQDVSKLKMEMRNLEKLKTKWLNSEFYETINNEIHN